MWPFKIEHPCQFTLNLILEMIDRAPVTFPETRREEMKKKHGEFLKDKKIACEKISEAVVSFGREIWPYRKAWEEMYAKYGLPNEAKYFEAEMPVALHDKYFSCKREGAGRCLREFRMGGKMEKLFTPDEKYELDQAVIRALDRVKKEVDELVLGEKKDEYQKLFEKWSAEQKVMIDKLEELKKMAAANPKWRAEILDKIKIIEEGWSMIEKDVSLKEIDKTIEFYQGAIESPEAY